MRTTKELKRCFKIVKKLRRAKFIAQFGISAVCGIGISLVTKISTKRAFSVEGIEHLMWAQERLDRIQIEKFVAILFILMATAVSISYIGDYFDKKKDEVLSSLKDN